MPSDKAVLLPTFLLRGLQTSLKDRTKPMSNSRAHHARTHVVRSARPSALLVTYRPVCKMVGLPRHFALLLLIAGGEPLVSNNVGGDPASTMRVTLVATYFCPSNNYL